jgi:DnaJ homologue, subfamily C, member 28, conserved domain
LVPAKNMSDHVPKPKLPFDMLAEQRIRAAQAAGEFDNLPGFGQPIPGIDEPHDELWWVKEKLKREQLSALPPALAIRLDVQRTLDRLTTLASEAEVRDEIAALNDRIKQASFAVTWGPSVDVVPLEVEQVVGEWHAGRRDARPT